MCSSAAEVVALAACVRALQKFYVVTGGRHSDCYFSHAEELKVISKF